MNSYKLSWTAYIKQILFIVFILSLIITIFGRYAFIVGGLWFTWSCLQVWENLVLRVYVDDNGVWIKSGIFPWNKGTYGLNWRDISDATYRTGFFSWALKSYTVTVSHRYTKENHLILSHIARGDELVMLVNQMVAKKDLY